MLNIGVSVACLKMLELSGFRHIPSRLRSVTFMRLACCTN
jgi:hypothetical protein